MTNDLQPQTEHSHECKALLRESITEGEVHIDYDDTAGDSQTD